MSSRVRTPLRILGSLALLAPLLWTGGRLAMDLRARPTARTPVAAVGAGTDVPLRAGTALRVPLATSREIARALVVRAVPPATTPRRLLYRLCVDARCVISERSFAPDGTLALPLPDGVLGGALSLTVLRAEGPDAVLHDRIGFPALEVVRGFSWAPPLRRAREMARAMAGVDLFPVALAAYGAGLLGALVIALTCTASRSAPRPAGHGEQDRQTDVPLPSSSQ